MVSAVKLVILVGQCCLWSHEECTHTVCSTGLEVPCEDQNRELLTCGAVIVCNYANNPSGFQDFAGQVVNREVYKTAQATRCSIIVVIVCLLQVGFSQCSLAQIMNTFLFGLTRGGHHCSMCITTELGSTPLLPVISVISTI